MKYLGIDYGTKQIGVASSDERGVFAFPLSVMSNDAKAIERLVEIIHKEKIGGVIVGDTRHLSGKENPVTADAQAFTNTLAKQAGIPVETMWEMWSSIEASRFAPKGREHDDSAAAAIILQRFLDMRKS